MMLWILLLREAEYDIGGSYGWWAGREGIVRNTGVSFRAGRGRKNCPGQ